MQEGQVTVILIIECTTSSSSSDFMRWCSRTILRCTANVLERRKLTKLKLHYDWRLRWSGLSFCWNNNSALFI